MWKAAADPQVESRVGVGAGPAVESWYAAPVATVVGALASGDDVETVAEAYALSRKQVLDALAYAAHVAAHQAPAVREAS